MNKQKAIEEISDLKGFTILDETINFDSEMISKKEVLNIVKQIDKLEKLYTVEIPNPNAGERPILYRIDGKVCIIFPSVPCWRTVKNAQLTESEIKQDFDWAFRWAKEVE